MSTSQQQDKTKKVRSSISGVVGIGASAGGYNAIKQFLQSMSADSGLSFVIVQHLDAKHKSLATELFSGSTAMPVVEAENGMVLQPNHIYTSPSDKEVSLLQDHLVLTERLKQESLPHMPIDHFFHSLAENWGTHAIGLILSGTGTDGSLGLKSVNWHEGLSIVQDPATAEFDGMPKSAIAARAANLVLAIEHIPQAINDYIQHPYASGTDKIGKDLDSKSIRALIDIVQKRRGYDFTGYKRSTLLRRVHRRISLLGLSALSKYVSVLKKNTQEVDALFKDLLIGVTDFFRDDEAWKTLDAEVITSIVKAKKTDEPIRIWIPGCSTGEEAYTMAMVVLDRVRLARKACPVQIFATDTNQDALEIGRLGCYPAHAVKQISSARLKRYFQESSDHTNFSVSSEVRACVVFGVQNLFADPPFGRVDLISCRNVLIYLEPDVQKNVLNIFHFALRSDAYLFLGSAESNGGRDDLFRPLSKRWRIFQRVGVTDRNLLRLPAKSTEVHAVTHTALQAISSSNQVAQIAQKLLLERFVPASVLVNSRNEALYFCGDTDGFLVRPRGMPTQDILLMVREGVRARLRAALKASARAQSTIIENDVHMKKDNGFESVQIVVTPQAGGDLGQLFLVVFHAMPTNNQAIDKRQTKDILVRQLEEELQVTRDDLLDSIEKYDAITADLKNSNEQIVLSNEELRSLNEELESSKEELQSLNEELSTVNFQLEAKLRELEISNNDLQNLLGSSDIATICLDNTLRIKWFTPAAKKQFHLIDSDVSRPVNDLLSALNDKELIPSVHVVMAKHVVPDYEFQMDNGRWFIRRVLPYKTENARIAGVIITYTDITDIHFAIEAAISTKKDLHISLERTDKLKMFSAALALAEDRERKILAQYLHDDFGQVLAVLALKTVTLRKQKISKSLQTMLDDCALTVDHLNEKMRELAFQLSPPMLDQLGAAAALQWVVDEIRHVYNLRITLVDDGLPKFLSSTISAIVIRTVRELLGYIAKQPKSQRVTLLVNKSEHNMLSIAIEDVVGHLEIGEARSEFGLRLFSLQERINLLDGELRIESIPDGGTKVTIKVPMSDVKMIESP
jgi:two-component system CheB/CheR fusion protein